MQAAGSRANRRVTKFQTSKKEGGPMLHLFCALNTKGGSAICGFSARRFPLTGRRAGQIFAPDLSPCQSEIAGFPRFSGGFLPVRSSRAPTFSICSTFRFRCTCHVRDLRNL
jgi:hypothetical protein